MDESPRTARARQVWDRTAPDYTREIAFLERHWFTGGREWLGARASGRILDVGVGTGRKLPYDPVASAVTGVDLSPAMLAVARTPWSAHCRCAPSPTRGPRSPRCAGSS